MCIETFKISFESTHKKPHLNTKITSAGEREKYIFQLQGGGGGGGGDFDVHHFEMLYKGELAYSLMQLS